MISLLHSVIYVLLAVFYVVMALSAMKSRPKS